MGAVWTIATKDLRLRLRDRSLVLFAVVAPFALAAALGAVLGPVDDGPSFTVGVTEESSPSRAGAALRDEVLPALEADGLVAATSTHPDRDALVAAVEAGEVDAGLVLPATDGTERSGVEVVAGSATGVAGAVLAAVARSVVGEAAHVGDVVLSAARSGVDPEAAAAVAASTPRAYELVDRAVGVRPLDTTTYVAGGIAVFFLLFAVGIAVTGLLEEERDGTLARLRTAPVPQWAPAAAKAVTAVVVGVTSMAVLVVATTLVLGASWGPPLLLVPLVLAAVLAATGVVSLVAAASRTPEAASGGQGVVATVLGALGGAFFPITTTGLLGVVSAVTPHRWFLQGLRDVAGGAGVDALVQPVAVLVLIAAVAAAGSAALVRRRAVA